MARRQDHCQEGEFRVNELLNMKLHTTTADVIQAKALVVIAQLLVDIAKKLTPKETE